ncbi:MAG: tRNA 5-methoxyuridine(34)/uridine 5-oxyacetic acid(34) synthase CmoB [Pseudomonadaceae bacterium]|nr:tRNA 5-methoxyuridine(34)/uridine 5-oxyacetic acid(34) synthase CmoB [Pseudomonadaceae bacterium]
MDILHNLRENLPADLPDWPLKRALARFSRDHHGDFDKWSNALENLPDLLNREVDLHDAVSVEGDVDTQKLTDALKLFHPWRKGPFSIAEVLIDTEWRSDFKWQRLENALGDLSGQRILDIGCGNGYFGWRMLGRGAREVVGIDPTLLFCMQHLAIEKYVQKPGNWVLPLGIEEIPNTTQFDWVLSMGVIYHRRDPQAHIEQLAALTRSGGHSIVESIVVEGSESLIPPGRYARMRNVWCVPSIDDLCKWLQRAGFTDVRVLDVSVTTMEEQRSTQWMSFDSLIDTLDPQNPQRTIEGHPAPVRAIVVGEKP